jgi:UDP-glucose 6-dehydrogenase
MNAGIAKRSVSTYVTTRITFANMLARLCEKVSGAIADAVCMDAYVKGAPQ